MAYSHLKKENTSALIDRGLLLANDNQELSYRGRALMRPQLNTNYRHLCSPSNQVTAELFGDNLPKAVKDITDTNRLNFKLTEDSSFARQKVADSTLFGMGRTDMVPFTILSTGSQKTSIAPFASGGSRRGRSATEFNFHAGHFDITSLCG